MSSIEEITKGIGQGGKAGPGESAVLPKDFDIEHAITAPNARDVSAGITTAIDPVPRSSETPEGQQRIAAHVEQAKLAAEVEQAKLAYAETHLLATHLETLAEDLAWDPEAYDERENAGVYAALAKAHTDLGADAAKALAERLVLESNGFQTEDLEDLEPHEIAELRQQLDTLYGYGLEWAANETALDLQARQAEAVERRQTEKVAAVDDLFSKIAPELRDQAKAELWAEVVALHNGDVAAAQADIAETPPDKLVAAFRVIAAGAVAQESASARAGFEDMLRQGELRDIHAGLVMNGQPARVVEAATPQVQYGDLAKAVGAPGRASIDQDELVALLEGEAARGTSLGTWAARQVAKGRAEDEARQKKLGMGALRQ